LINLNKKGVDKPKSCKFCEESKNITHLFFEYVVVDAIWGYASEFLGFDIGSDYISVVSKWISRERFYIVNIISAAVL
jgi:hypothetical protein